MTKIKKSANSLQGFIDVVTRMAIDRRKKDDECLLIMKRDLPLSKMAIRKMNNVEIVEYLLIAPRSDSDPRIVVLHSQLLDFTKKEILARLENNHG